MSLEGKEVPLETTEMERDLGVNVDAQLEFDKHIEMQVNKANKLLGMIQRSYTFLDFESMLQLYRSIIRPTKYEKDRKMIKGVQRSATKMVLQLKKARYEERLKAMGLPSIYYRRV